MGIILAIILFSLIIIIHELGHFTLAKLNGIAVWTNSHWEWGLRCLEKSLREPSSA